MRRRSQSGGIRMWLVTRSRNSSRTLECGGIPFITCQRRSPRLSRGDVVQEIISLRKRVGVGLYWVATGAGYRSLANLFGIAKLFFLPDYIKLPQGDDLQEVLRGFRQSWGSPSVPGRSTGAVQRGSQWRQSRTKRHLAVQTAVTFKAIRYLSDSVPHLKVAWFWFENVRFNATCAVHTAKSKSDMVHIWAKKSDSAAVWPKPKSQ